MSSLNIDETAIREDERLQIALRRAEADIRKEERAKATYEALSEAERQARRLEQQAKEEAEKEKKRTADTGFAKVYHAGFHRIRSLISSNRSAAILYTYLAEHTDKTTGTVVASQEVLEEGTGLSRTTLWRASKYLESDPIKAMVRIKVGGGVYAYALNPDEVWKAWDSQKATAAFNTKTLVRKRDAENSTVKRNLSVMMKEIRDEQDGQPSLPLEDTIQ